MLSSASANPVSTSFLNYFTLGENEIFGLDGDESSLWSSAVVQDSLTAAVARGMSIRIGRIAFLYWLREHQQQLGWEDLSFKILPNRKKLLSGLEAISSWVKREAKVAMEIADFENEWKLSCSPPNSSTQTLVPYQWEFLQGFIQEFTRWVGQGRLFNVQLTRSEAAIAFTISKLPID